MKKLLLILFLPFAYFQLSAQQDPLYAQYINNPLVINPAYTGINNVLNASLSYRTQWTGFEGSPNTVALTGHSSILNNVAGVGLMIVRDELGPFKNTQINATGAYKISLPGEAYFSFGMQAGINSVKEDNSELNVQDNTDDLFNSNYSYSKFNVGVGVLYKSPRLYLGLSIPKLINSKEDFDNIETQLYQRHVYLAAAYLYHINSDLSLKPAILLKGVSDAPVSIDINANVVIRDKYIVGLLTRNFETYGLLAQLNINHNFRLGYVAELPTNKSVGTQYSTHEISLTLDLEVFDFHFLDERHF